MSSAWSNGKVSISIFGESHGNGIGVIIDSPPPGLKLDMDYILEFMARRAPGWNTAISTTRRESDYPHIMSGVVNGTTTGTPLCGMIENTNTKSSDYDEFSYFARPGHGDYTGFLRYKGFNDVRGGGHFSGRLTAPLVFAGAIFGLYLESLGIHTGGHVLSIRKVKDQPFDPVKIDSVTLTNIKRKPIPVIDDNAGKKMVDEIDSARKNLDSVGGIIECAATEFPAGIGNPMFGGLENVISSLVFGVPAVKGIEFGAGFEAANLFGSENNDEYFMDGDEIRTRTNNHGGILGGISSGMPIIFRVAIKPTPSIAKTQNTVDFKAKKDAEITINGRHDPCIAVRAVPVIESCLNIALASFII